MIDRGITYDDLEGLETILRLKAAGNRTAAKPNYEKRKYKKLNGNIFELPISDEWWLIKEEEENETDDDESRRKITEETLIASAPHPDDNWIGLWEDLLEKGIVPKSIRSLTEFKSWFHSQDLDIPLYSAAGIVDTYPGRILLNRMRRR